MQHEVTLYDTHFPPFDAIYEDNVFILMYFLYKTLGYLEQISYHKTQS